MILCFLIIILYSGKLYKIICSFLAMGFQIFQNDRLHVHIHYRVDNLTT